MKKITLLLLLCSPVCAVAQILQQEINDQVWKRFIESFNSRDAEGFMSVHSRDVIRSPRDSKMIYGFEEYEGQMKNQSPSNGRTRSIELRFTERIANGNLAMDVGIYKTTSVSKDGKGRSFYGRFHVVLRKEQGTWKILVDTDSSEGGTIGEKEFLAAQSMP